MLLMEQVYIFFYTFKLRYLIRRISFNDNDLNELLLFLDLLMSGIFLQLQSFIRVSDSISVGTILKMSG